MSKEARLKLAENIDPSEARRQEKLARIEAQANSFAAAGPEWLDLHEFNSIAHAQLLATQWLWQYNNERPNTAIGGVPPTQRLQTA